MGNETAPTLASARPHPLPPPWVGDLLAAVLVVVAAFVPFPDDEYRPRTLLAIAVLIAPAGLLPLRRRWPLQVLAGTLALFGAAALIGTLSPGIVLASAIAMFGVTNRSSRRVGLIATACAIASLILLSLLYSVHNVFDPRTIQFAATVAFAAAAGDATRYRREYIQSITERAERAEQGPEAEASRRVAEERLRIARDLHDAVAHQISVISLNAGVASTALDSRPERSREALAAIRVAARTVLREIGDLLEVLRSGDDDSPSLLPQPGLAELGSLITSFGETGLAVNIRMEGDLARIDGAAELVAYRVIQEALTNAHKHGSEHRAHVLISIGDDEALIVISNPTFPQAGRSSPHPGSNVGGHGLLGMRERVASVRGTITFGATGTEYRVDVVLPIAKEKPQ